jgi:type IX secretion system PorP/SprF family membrane protein
MNKKIIAVAIIFLSVICNSLFAQELPLLNPGYANSFLYNPSLAGGSFNTNGSFFIANKNSFVDINGHPASGILSAHMPIKKYSCGIGSNIFFNSTNVFQTFYSSIAFAYHIVLDRDKSLSFGLSADLYHIGVDMSEVNITNNNLPDPNIFKYSGGKWLLNFSSGFNFQTNLFTLGGTVNNLRSSIVSKTNTAMSSYYSAYLKFSIPAFLNRDIIQPMIIYRQLPFSNPVGNAGLFYSYKSKNSIDRFNDGYLLGGVFLNTNLQVSILAGFKILKRMQLTYNYESSGQYQGYIGASHEIMIIYNIIELSPSDRSNEYLTWYGKKLKLKRFFSTLKKKNRN